MTRRSSIQSSSELIAHAIALAAERKPTVAVAAAQDIDVIGAVAEAEADGFLHGVLVGDREQITRLAEESHIAIESLEIVDRKEVGEASHTAVRLAADGRADAVMKGFLPTSALLKILLDKQFNLKRKDTLSHCAVLEIPGYHKLLNFTDGGMVVKPNTEQKLQILENAVFVARALGASPVKVAVSAAADRVSEKMPHTLADLNDLIPRAREHLTDVAIQGPLTLDAAMSRTAAEYHGIGGQVAGDADVFLVDSIEEGNLVAKSLIQFADAVFAGVIVGAAVPVALVSRTDTARNKKASLAITCVIAAYHRQRQGTKAQYD